MRRVTAIMLVATLLPGEPASAGAWLRDKGEGFVSVTTTRRNAAGPRDEFGLYGEFGAFEHVTAGIDIDETRGSSGHALIFARFPLGPHSGARRLALELGLGRHHSGAGAGAGTGAMARATLSWGMGFSGPGAGWIAIQPAIEYRAGAGGPIYKLDAALGLPSRSRIRPMLQLETTYADAWGASWSLIPSLILSGRGGRRWVVGIEARSAASRSLGLKLSLWQEF